MTPEEINKVLAERVMGWSAQTKVSSSRSYMKYWDKKTGEIIMYISTWNPTSDLNQAFLVVEKTTCYLQLDSPVGEIYWEARLRNSIGEMCGYGEASTPAEAICLAAIQLVQEGK